MCGAVVLDAYGRVEVVVLDAGTGLCTSSAWSVIKPAAHISLHNARQCDASDAPSDSHNAKHADKQGLASAAGTVWVVEFESATGTCSSTANDILLAFEQNTAHVSLQRPATGGFWAQASRHAEKQGPAGTAMSSGTDTFFDVGVLGTCVVFSGTTTGKTVSVKLLARRRRGAPSPLNAE